MKRILFLVMVFAVINLSALQISEFIVTPTSSEAIEFYNDEANDVVLSDYILITSGSTWADTFILPADTLAPGAYISYDNDSIYNAGGVLGLSNGGMYFTLTDSAYNVVDAFGYGSFGPVPAPIYLWSTARVSSTGDYAADFNMDPTPTLGSANDAATNALGTGTVFFNEAYMDTLSNKFIELYNSSSTGVDISGWAIIMDDDYYFPSGTIIPGNGYVVIDTSDFPQYFISYGDVDYQVLYLFDNNFSRIDQFGWDVYVMDSSFSVRPNGVRTVFDGYSVASSPDFEYYVPTPAAANPVIETFNSKNYNVKINSIPGVGIEILSGNTKGKMEIMDITGRVIYKSNLKSMVFLAKSGVYFVNIISEKDSFIKKVEIIK